MKTSPHFEIPCVILCGGKSSRMGEDKALLPLANYNTLSQFQYDRLKPYFKNIYLSSKTDKFNFPNNLILDTQQEYSPIVALKTIFETLKDINSLFIITVDNPFVTIGTIEKLINNSQEYDITVAKTSRIHNLCGVFKKSNLLYINEMLLKDIHKVGFLLKNSNTNVIEFENEDEFLNLNNKEDYSKAKSIIS